MKCILFFTVFFSSLSAIAQVSKVSLQASGFTCSMCSNSVYKSLKTIPSVDKIEANIKTSTFEITFKPNQIVDFNKLKGKVEDAGYSVAKFVVTVRCMDVKAQENSLVKIGSNHYRLLNPKEQLLHGEKELRIVNKGFVPEKDFKRHYAGIKEQNGVYHAVL